MKAAFLPDRGVVKVSGEDARNFLNCHWPGGYTYMYCDACQ